MLIALHQGGPFFVTGALLVSLPVPRSLCLPLSLAWSFGYQVSL